MMSFLLYEVADDRAECYFLAVVLPAAAENTSNTADPRKTFSRLPTLDSLPRSHDSHLPPPGTIYSIAK